MACPGAGPSTPSSAGVLVLAALGGGAWLYLHRHAGDGGQTLTLYGDVDVREAQPAFDDSGVVASIAVQEGSQVKRGDLLATLDDRRYAAALDQARYEDFAAGRFRFPAAEGKTR